MTGETVVRLVLGVLAAYHLVIGVASVVSFQATARLAESFYGVRLAENPQLRYAVRMLGLYALALGVLLSRAVMDPAGHRETVYVVAALELARAVCRVVYARELTSAFRVPAGRNALNVVVLVLAAGVLAIGVPR